MQINVTFIPNPFQIREAVRFPILPDGQQLMAVALELLTRILASTYRSMISIESPTLMVPVLSTLVNIPSFGMMHWPT